MIETTVDPDQETDEDLTSRTDARGARKRSEAAWAEFAKTLITISERQLLRLELPEEVLRVVQDARRVQSPGAKNRALRLVRKEMRDLDLLELRQRLEDLSHPSAPRAPNALEAWRTRLLAGGATELAAFVDEHAQADRQRLRSLLRNAKKAEAAPAHKKALALLDQALREALSGA
jgi:ribosome-associated protein